MWQIKILWNDNLYQNRIHEEIKNMLYRIWRILDNTELKLSLLPICCLNKQTNKKKKKLKYMKHVCMGVKFGASY
jgi:hypothetical protein